MRLPHICVLLFSGVATLAQNLPVEITGSWLDEQNRISLEFLQNGMVYYDERLTAPHPKEKFPSIISGKSVRKKGKWSAAGKQISITWEDGSSLQLLIIRKKSRKYLKGGVTIFDKVEITPVTPKR